MSYHFEDTSHTCNVYETPFTQKCELKRHMLVHARDTQNKCGTCGKK